MCDSADFQQEGWGSEGNGIFHRAKQRFEISTGLLFITVAIVTSRSRVGNLARSSSWARLVLEEEKEKITKEKSEGSRGGGQSANVHGVRFADRKATGCLIDRCDRGHGMMAGGRNEPHTQETKGLGNKVRVLLHA